MGKRKRQGGKKEKKLTKIEIKMEEGEMRKKKHNNNYHNLKTGKMGKRKLQGWGKEKKIVKMEDGEILDNLRKNIIIITTI